MSDKKLVQNNVTYRVNKGDIAKEDRDGRETWVVTSKFLGDDIVMNGILYKKDEIAASYWTFEGVPVTNGHPMMDGEYISAQSPEGMVRGWFGGHLENVRQEKDKRYGQRVWADAVIDVARAKESKMGRQVIKALEQGDPISTSIGVYCFVDSPDKENDDYWGVAKGMWADHNAILPNEEPAHSTDEGTGIFVNKKGERQTLVVNNLTESKIKVLTDSEKRGIRKNNDNLSDQEEIKMAEKDEKDEITISKGDGDAITISADSSKAPSLSDEDIGKIADVVVSKLDARDAEKKAQEVAANRKELEDKVIAINGLSPEVIPNASDDVLRDILEHNKPADAAPVVNSEPKDEVSDEDLSFV